MSIPWDLTLEDLEKSDHSEELTQPSALAHFCSLRLDREPVHDLQTGLMCELGAAHLDPAVVRRLLAAGLTVARLDLRRLEPPARTQLVQSVRRAALDYSADLGFVYPLAVALDVRGPDIAIGGLARAPLYLSDGTLIRLTTDVAWRDSGTADCLYVGWDRLTDLQQGDVLHIDALGPQRVELTVIAVDDDSLECSVARAGTLGPHATIQVSQVPRDAYDAGDERSADSLSGSVTSKVSMEHADRQVAWAVAHDVDALLVPAQSAADVTRVREALGEPGRQVLTIACIETEAGVGAADEILEVADGLYLDRSTLSVDLPVEKIFIAQKTLVAKCSRSGKPCICRSVINEQIPTLCVSDLAGLVIDGVDVIALELHYEHVPIGGGGEASSRAAEQCLAAAGVVCRQAERAMYKPQVYGNLELMQSPLEDPSRAVCVGAVELAMRTRAVAILCLTTSGRSARLVSHARAPCPVVAVTRSCRAARQLRLWRGVRSLHYTEEPQPGWVCEVEARVRAALRYLTARGAIHAGDAYVVTAASRRGAGYTDSVRLVYASAADTLLE